MAKTGTKRLNELLRRYNAKGEFLWLKNRFVWRTEELDCGTGQMKRSDIILYNNAQRTHDVVEELLLRTNKCPFQQCFNEKKCGLG